MKHDGISFIALDLDGTILDERYRMSGPVVETLRHYRSKGKKIIISTGRVLSSAKKHTAGILEADAWVCSNGADIYDISGAPISRTHLGDADSRRLVALSRRFDSHFHAFIGDDWYYEREKPYTAIYAKRSGIEGIKADFDDFAELSFTKCIFMDDHERLEALQPLVEGLSASSMRSMYSAPFMLEVVAAGVSKAAGLRACVESMGGSLGNIIAFGDAENDEEMLLESGIGVAMGNAPPELKAKASFVAPSVDEDGVARFLRGFFGN